MRTLIVFATKHGTTSACANLLAKQLDGEVVLCQLGKQRVPQKEEAGGTSVATNKNIEKIDQMAISRFATVMNQQ